MTQTLKRLQQVALIAICSLLISSLEAQVEFGIKLEDDGKTYTVSLVPNANWSGNQALTIAGQATLVIPIGGFQISNIQSIAGNWSLSPTPIISPPENPSKEYQFFNLVGTTTEIIYNGLSPVDLFSFENSGVCTGQLELIDHDTDPMFPTNSLDANVGNLIVPIGAGGSDAYRGNYNPGNADCTIVDQNCEVQFDIELLSDQKTYSISINSFVDWPTPVQNITSNLLVTVRVPTGGFNITALQNKVNGAVFEQGSEYRSPPENPAYDYISFNLSGTTTALLYSVGGSQEIFTFQNDGTCGSNAVTIVQDNDPFVVSNNQGANPRNQITTNGGGLDIDPCEVDTELTCSTVATNGDDDDDGVLNSEDQCPNTVAGATVNAVGCTDDDGDGFYPDVPSSSDVYDPNDNDQCIPDATRAVCLDSDGDGVDDENDQCPNTLPGASVNAAGCTDDDGDGYYPDANPNGPNHDTDDTDGCIPDRSSPTCNDTDTDQDGVPDINDRCPNSQPGASVNALGCTDVDGDGNYPDANPDDPKYDPNDNDPCLPDDTVGGCDTDNDNVPDGLDECPNTLAGVSVNAAGCTDDDGDGYYPDAPDTSDKYDPNDDNACIPDITTPACQVDDDEDGVPNDNDLCPNTPPGTVVGPEGCEDRDGDGYYPELPSGDPRYDPEDTNPCEPDNTVPQCDDDLDGIVNGFDDCPFSAAGASVDGKGCTDDDGDGFYPDIDPTFDNYDPDDADPCVPNVRTSTCNQDDDGDGVLDRDDLCLNTPPNVKVNAQGCSDEDGDGYFPGADPNGPSHDPDDTNPCEPDNTVALCDDDNDGVPNGNDDCPFSAIGATVNSAGCTDNDGDGNYPDVDPNFPNYDGDDDDPCTPNNTISACDSDGDGIPDGLDPCPNTPPGATTNSNGCSDDDGDGFSPGLPSDDPNYDPDDNNPCVPDNSVAACDDDGDGVPGADDLCPNTPAGATVNEFGCVDDDGDGFYPDADPNDDKYDPNDNDTCIPDDTNPLCDDDGDGIPDGQDQCPNTLPGATVNSIGCTDVDLDGYYPDADPGALTFDPDDNDKCVPDNSDPECQDKVVIALVNSMVYLMGPYDCTFGMMNDNLRTSGHIPSNEPYNDWVGANDTRPYAHVANDRTEVIADGVLDVEGNDAIVDWIFVALRDKNDSSKRLFTRSALLQRDGDIVDLDGVSAVEFTAPVDEYYIEINHRNHLGVMTDAPVTLVNKSFQYDFTSLDAKTFGSGAQREIGTFATTCKGGFSNFNVMWAGDADADGFVVLEGGGQGVPEKGRIVSDALSHPLNENASINYSAPGYYGGDTNMDGNARAQGLNNDLDIMVFFNILDNPGNPNLMMNYVITEQLAK